MDCTSLESVSIPASVHLMKMSVFQSCPALREITVAADNAYYSSADGVLFAKKGDTVTTIMKYPA